MTSNTNKTIASGHNEGGVVLNGYLKKLKTMKKKYFALYEDCGKSLARLEYYDNEKKFKSKASPKRSIILTSCFNINRCLDTKHDFVITLSTKDGSFGIVMDTEEEMDTWLKAMLKLQSGQNIFSGPPRPYYEHVWQVLVQRKGLAEKKGILGSYHVCLSSKSVTLIRIGLDRTNIGETRVPVIEFYLTSIRSCGDSKCYFYMEVGRHSVTGAGELWMETKDPLTAQNMHTMILNVMSTNADDPYGPMRKRSSSATETSKPVTILQRRQTHSGSKTLNSSPLSVGNRDRCDSLPSSRNRTVTESSSTSMPPSRTMSSLSNVPNSVYNRHSHSPPMNSNALSPSAGCSESDGSTLSIDEPDSTKNSHTADESTGCVSRFYNSRSPGGVIPEENSDEFWYAENKKQNASILDKLNIHTLQPTEGRKTTLSSSSNAQSDEPESQYMDMFNSISPCESAQCDTTLAGAECPFKSCNDSSDGNSRASSLAEDIVDGYVHMSSPQTSDYVDMEQSLKNRRHFNVNTSLQRSAMHGMPLKDMSFEEYPIEKVPSGIYPDEDEAQSLNERPPRAYSVGSRMEHNNQKLRIEVIANTDQTNCRVRAFSVGSRSKVPRCDLQRNVLLTAAATSVGSNTSNTSNSKTSIASMEPTSESAVRGRKSSSAPLLIHKSQNSVDRMDDLMEIDFSKNSSSRSNSLSSQSPGASSSYLANLPKGSHLRSSILSSSPKSHDSFSEPIQIRANAPPSSDNGYLEMRPVMYSNSVGSNDESADHLSVPNESSISESPTMTRSAQQNPTHSSKFKIEDSNKFETPEGYLEMSWNGNKDHSYVVHDQLNNRHLVNELAKSSRSPYTLMEAKKTRGITKMPSISACQSLINNNRSTATNNNSKLSILHSQNQANQKIVLAKTECSQRKRFFDHVNNSSFTISEEKTDQDATTISEKFKNLSVQLASRKASLVNENSADVNVDLATDDSDCYNYKNFSADISKKNSSPKKAEIDVKTKEVDCKLNVSNRSLDKINSMHSKSESFDKKKDSPPLDEANKFARKSNSPKCTPTSRCNRFSNTNRQTKDTGYELLHIRSDSSLQTKKNISRPSSVNSDRIFPLDSAQCRPNSVNSDFVHMNSVSSSAATLCHFASPKMCDNRIQDPLTLKPVPICNNAYIDDNKQKSSDSMSSKPHLVHSDSLNSPASKLAALCQLSSNPELELHYASLDLPVSSTKNSNTTIYGSAINSTAARSSTSDDTPTSLSPNSNTSQQSAFTYAKIDFNQCENKKFKCATQSNL